MEEAKLLRLAVRYGSRSPELRQQLAQQQEAAAARREAPSPERAAARPIH